MADTRAKLLRKQRMTRELAVKGKFDCAEGDIVLIEGVIYVVGDTHYHEQGNYTYIDAHLVELVDDIVVKDVNMCSG